MPSKPRPKKSRGNAQHPIRIVPLHRPEAPREPAAAPPQLTYRNGPLLTAAEVFTIFWGSAWRQAPNASLIAELNSFFDFVLTSSLIDQLAEYNVPGKSIGHGSRIGTLTFTVADPPSTVQDSDIQRMLEQQMGAGTLPRATANTLYFVFLPDGVQVEQGGSASCQAFCGYHDAFRANIFYAVMPYPGCAGCVGGLSLIDALTSTSSHELCEAITDPIPGQGWYDDNHGEIGDICAWKTKKLSGYTVQLEWSNRQNACV